LANILTTKLDAFLPTIILVFIALSSVLTLVYRLFQPKFIYKNKFLKELFDVSPIWTGIRLIGFILAVMTYFQWGPAFIWSMDTGGLILYDLIKDLFAIFLFAGRSEEHTSELQSRFD